MSETVSIALATYNGAKFLPEQLQSFVIQRRRPDEVVITDDGSTDDTIPICQDFALRAPFKVSFVRNSDRLGLHKNFERAISLTTGDIICISDQDDAWYPQKISTVVAEFEARPGMLAIHHDEHILDYDSGQILERTASQSIDRIGGWTHTLYAGNCTAIRQPLKDVLLPFPDGDFYDEWLTMIPELLRCRLRVNEPLQAWRRHDENSSMPLAAEDGVSQWTEFRRLGLNDARLGWKVYQKRLLIAAERIGQHESLIDQLLGSGRAYGAVERTNAVISAIHRRIASTSLPRSRRWLSIARNWTRGDYQIFSGWKSALKDIVRPTA